MDFKTYFKRIFKNKIKIIPVAVLFLIPMADFFQILHSVIDWGITPPVPEFATFISLYTVGTAHFGHKLMFWFLPLYFLLIFAEPIISDYDTGYREMLIERVGKRKYVKSNIISPFVFSMIIVTSSLMLNYIMMQITFKDGTHMSHMMPIDTDPWLYHISMEYPNATNIIYNVMIGILSGLIASVGASLALLIHNRKIVYGLTFMLWFIPIVMKNSLIIAIQPFMEYGLKVVGPTIISVMLVYVIIILSIYFVENRNETL